MIEINFAEDKVLLRFFSRSVLKKSIYKKIRGGKCEFTNGEKYPVEKAKGSAKKYSEL